MDSNGEVEHEEELDFHLEATEDICSGDDDTPSNQNLSSEEDGNANNEKKMFRSMSHAAEQHTILDEYWDMVNMTFATAGEAYIFYSKYARDKGFSVRKQKVRI
uniref:Protein FAR1-RELATED SEQUENCE n=1 Tax=Setaria viridis TaxID=4556 RepID=A0A4U6TQY6_SETVI|nr:hypothetical protein SEVIR_7G151200v2 [Setaria viridis]